MYTYIIFYSPYPYIYSIRFIDAYKHIYTHAVAFYMHEYIKDLYVCIYIYLRIRTHFTYIYTYVDKQVDIWTFNTLACIKIILDNTMFFVQTTQL